MQEVRAVAFDATLTGGVDNFTGIKALKVDKFAFISNASRVGSLFFCLCPGHKLCVTDWIWFFW